MTGRAMLRQYGTVTLAAVGVVAVLTTGAVKWAAVIVFAALLLTIFLSKVTEP
jgi:hypothetical protein